MSFAMFENIPCLLLASIIAFGFAFYLIMLLFIPGRVAAFWQVLPHHVAQDHRRLTIRTLAMASLFFLMGIVSLVPYTTPHFMPYEYSFWIGRVGIGLSLIAGSSVIATYSSKR